MTIETVTPTVSRLEYGPGMRIVNALVGAADAFGVPIGRIEEDSILAAAQRQTGLQDFGGDEFLAPMRAAIRTVSRPEFTSFGRVVLRQSWLRALANRLELVEFLKSHPAVREQRVQRPIFVLGFPRTGTTLLQNLLAADPGRRGVEFWELMQPVPVAAELERDRSRRRSAARVALQAAYQVAPEMAAVHYIDVDTLEECWPLFASSFTVVNYELQSGGEDYGDFVMNHCDMRGSYARYKQFLQVILDRAALPGEQLVLKCPEHLWFLDSLLHVFPDACVVWTHRDPYDTIASYCSLMSLQWRTLFGRIDRPAIGAYMQRRMHVGIQRALEARKTLDPARFFDVKFEEVVRDPGGLVRRISEHFDLEVQPDHDARVAAYLGKKRADERGQHKYDGRLYGLDRGSVHAQYREYIESIGVEVRTAG